jgi:hypothetical protein
MKLNRDLVVGDVLLVGGRMVIVTGSAELCTDERFVNVTVQALSPPHLEWVETMSATRRRKVYDSAVG